MQIGLGDVSLYIEVKKIRLKNPYSYQYSRHSQPTQLICGQGYATSSHFPQFEIPEWSNYYFGGGCNNEAFEVYAGGSSSHPVHKRQEDDHHEMQEQICPNIDVKLSSPRPTVTGKKLTLINENTEYDEDTSSSDDFEEFSDDEEDLSEGGDEEATWTDVVQGGIMFRGHHGLKRGLYTRLYKKTNLETTDLAFDRDSEELFVGQILTDKEALIAAMRQIHIIIDRTYIVTRSNPEQFIVKCVVENCLWRLIASKRKKHKYFEISKCKGHNCMVSLLTPSLCLYPHFSCHVLPP